jgi:hypothetical protein
VRGVFLDRRLRYKFSFSDSDGKNFKLTWGFVWGCNFVKSKFKVSETPSGRSDTDLGVIQDSRFSESSLWIYFGMSVWRKNH